MERQPLVSIALCTYNGAAFLEQQLDSVLNQTYTNWEIIAIDDQSHDSTWQILEAYAAKDIRFSISQNEQNLGYNKNFEKALCRCRGTFIALCDQDDIWHTEKLTLQLQNIQANDLIYHDSAFINESNESLNLRISDKFNFYRGNQPEVFLLMNCVSGHSIFMRSSLLKYALPFPIDFHYDQWLAFVAANKGSIDFIEKPLVNYRLHRGNNTDILASKSKLRDISIRINELKKEVEWLRICANFKGLKSGLTSKLFKLGNKRNSSFANFAYGWLIWQHREVLLFLFKKSEVSKFFFALKKVWGPRAKRLF